MVGNHEVTVIDKAKRAFLTICSHSKSEKCFAIHLIDVGKMFILYCGKCHNFVLRSETSMAYVRKSKHIINFDDLISWPGKD